VKAHKMIKSKNKVQSLKMNFRSSVIKWKTISKIFWK